MITLLYLLPNKGQSQSIDRDQDESFENFFLIDSVPSENQPTESFIFFKIPEPTSEFFDLFQFKNQNNHSSFVIKDRLPLLHWNLNRDSAYHEPTRYNRAKHFKNWIKDPSRETCFNIRGLVLKRQARKEIITHPQNSCSIMESEWYDPYTDRLFDKAQDLQVDHVVPLKNAYLAGAWSWPKSKRCHYANFIEDETHLIAVAKNANEKKGDRSPDRYLPPHYEFQCQYLSIWLKIKAIWKLKISLNEGRSIREIINKNNCNPNLFFIKSNELKFLQSTTEIPPAQCEGDKIQENQN